MPLVLPTKTIEKLTKLKEPEEFRDAVFDMVDVDAIDIYLNRILTVVYLNYGVTAGGIILPDQKKDEDIWQGKVALVLKVGPTAFVDGDGWNFFGQNVTRGDWVTFRINHASQIEIQSVPCRIVTDRYVEMRVPDPRMVTS